MSGDTTAINSWARSYAQRALAVAMNTGVSVSQAKETLIARDARAKGAMAANRKGRTGK